MRLLIGLLTLLALASPALAAGRPMTVDDLLSVRGVSDPQVSPDGKWIVYVVGELDREADRTNSDLWLVPTKGGKPKRLTWSPAADSHPRWKPDGKTIAFTSNRAGSSQIWLLDIDGGEARQLTKLDVEVSGPLWSPGGDKLAFAAEVYPANSPEKTAEKDEEKGEAKSKVRIYDSLMIRHWMAWDEGKRSHLFVADAATGEAVDLTPALKVNTPPAPFGGSSDYAWSPDGKELAFTAEPAVDLAWSTNTDVWTVDAAGGEPVNRTESNEGADAQPAYSPDGKHLAYVSQARAGFEADLWVLTLLDRKSGNITKLGTTLDRPISSYAWRGSDEVVAVIDDAGRPSIVSIPLDGEPKRLVTEGTNSAAAPIPGGGLVFVRTDAAHPAELFRSYSDGTKVARLTHHNDDLIAKLDVSPAESFTFKGADGDDVSGWLVKPPGFDPSKKYPVLFLIHGGPQGAWHDEWHARWNDQMFASTGFAVVAINPRGSTGYGQKFTDQISKDWTGRVYEDLMKGLDHAIQTYSFLDGDRVAAAGGSYGGFMVNWIAGHTDRFKALISHAGVFDLTSKYGTTEELWFPEWEFGGPPWEEPSRYREQSPSTYVKEFKTPTLVIHGALDFRVHDAQGLGMFTSLQRMKVPSRYVWFPDEGHWILKPQNRIVWWREMLAWIDKYAK
jgi:dipeptidyl aminopeptidase/acylaminoacyl peptidase